jgi:hypothetical protein
MRCRRGFVARKANKATVANDVLSSFRLLPCCPEGKPSCLTREKYLRIFSRREQDSIPIPTRDRRVTKMHDMDLVDEFAYMQDIQDPVRRSFVSSLCGAVPWNSPCECLGRLFLSRALQMTSERVCFVGAANSRVLAGRATALHAGDAPAGSASSRACSSPFESLLFRDGCCARALCS